jgi:hypothetical protein
MYSGKIAVPPGGGGIRKKNHRFIRLVLNKIKTSGSYPEDYIHT